MSRRVGEWTWSKMRNVGTLRTDVASETKLIAKIELIEPHGDCWWHVRLFERLVSRDGAATVNALPLSALRHSAMRRTRRQAIREGRRAMVAAVRLAIRKPDPLDDLFVALKKGEKPPLRWIMEHGSRGDPVAAAWSASRNAIAMFWLADFLRYVEGLVYDFDYRDSRVLSGATCVTVRWRESKPMRRYDILGSTADADDIRKRVPLPTFAQCLAKLDEKRSHDV